MAKVRARLQIAGRVQGVYYRVYAQREGARLGLFGWVRNLADGRVEALVEGESDAVDAYAIWCHRGSPASKVTQVDVQRETYLGEFTDFLIEASE